MALFLEFQELLLRSQLVGRDFGRVYGVILVTVEGRTRFHLWRAFELQIGADVGPKVDIIQRRIRM